MIADNLKNAHFYYNLEEKYRLALEFLKNTDLMATPNGKYPIKGDEIYAIVQEYSTKQESEGKLEAHQKYTDIQYIISGEEKLGYAYIERFSPTTPYDQEKDIIFGEGTCSFIEAQAGDFLIFTPQDAHMPCISIDSVTPVKKVVIKVLTSNC